MELHQLLKAEKDIILNNAFQSLKYFHLKHYQYEIPDEVQQRLRNLYELILECLEKKNLAPIINFSKEIAQERFNSGYDLYEVQTVFNIIEEIIWQQILKNLSSEDLTEALGMMSTILGAGKDSLARTYVSLATKTKVTSLDLKPLFQGTEGESNKSY